MRISPLVLTIACGSGALVVAADPVPPVPAAVARQNIETAADHELVAAIQRRLVGSTVVLDRQLTVQAANGIVTIGGTLDSILGRDHVLAIAKSTPGARAVIDLVSAVPPVRPASNLLTDARVAFDTDPALGSRDLRVQVVGDRELVVSGIVPSMAVKQLALLRAMAVRGVTAVRDAILIGSDEADSGDRLRATVTSALDACLPLRGTSIAVSVTGREIHLAGAVSSPWERAFAETIAKSTGAATVDDALSIEAALLYHLPSASPIQDGRAAEAAIREAFGRDRRLLRSDDLHVAVDDQVATVAGHVGSLAERVAAIEDAHGAAGVGIVQDAVTVMPPTVDADLGLATEARSALRADPLLAQQPVFVQVERGAAVLVGAVTDAQQRARALADLAAVSRRVAIIDATVEVRRYEMPTKLSGFADVARVPGYADPSVLVTRLWTGLPVVPRDSELERRARGSLDVSPLVDASRVTVGVEDGRVILIGTVRDWLERNLAEVAAGMAGAVAVVNRLDVDTSTGSGA